MTTFQQGFQFFMLRAFNIRAGEINRAGLMLLNIFLIISTLLIVKPTVNSLFLSKFGVENLPKVFVLVAIIAAIVSTLYSRILSKYSLGKIIGNTLIFSVVSLIVFGILLNLNLMAGPILYAFYVWVAVFALLTTSQFWILANIVFNAREAKRLFGFIGAGAIAGGIFGGYLTTLLAPVIGSERLLFVGALLLLFCLPITRYIWRSKAAGKPLHYRQEKRTAVITKHPFQIIKSSRHLTFLASIVGVSVIVAKLVDYQFSAVASEKITNPDELTAFFGFWFSNLNVVSLGIQLFITSRVVGTLGVGTSLFFLPGGILLGALALLVFPELWAAVFIKICDGSLKQSINRASVELLALPIPIEIKNQTKTFIDVFVDSLATGIGGLILIFLVSGLDLPPRFISLMILLLILVWVYFALQVRKEYIKSFKLKVAQVKDDRNEINEISIESVLGGFKKVLETGSERQVLYVLQKAREIKSDKLFESIRKLINHQSGDVRAEALRSLYFYQKPNISNEVELLTTDMHQQVKIEAFEYLIEHSTQDTIALMSQYLSDPDYKVSGAALLSLAIETKDNLTLKNAFDLGHRIKERLEILKQLNDDEEKKFRTINTLKVIGESSIPYYYQTIEQYFSDTDIDVVNQAIASAGNTMIPQFIDPLINFLEGDGYRESAVDALANYGQGIISVFEELVSKSNMDVEIIRALPKVVQRIPSQQSVDFLFGLMDYEDHSVRLSALRSLNTLKIEFPQLRFHKKDILERVLEEAHLYLNTLSVLYAQTILADSKNKIWDARRSLIDLLERRLDGNLERIFRLLGLKYPPEDIINIYEGIQSKKPDMRINAIEFLDNLLEPNLKRVLVPIVETALLETISEDAIKNLHLKIPDEFECFEMLLKARDIKIKLAVLYLIAQLKDEQFEPLLKPYLDNENYKVKDFASRAKSAIDNG